MSAGTIIIGAGQAGAQAATSLRAAGYSLPITILGDEGIAPYQRPPLSKTYLAGTSSVTDLYLRPDEFWAAQKIDMMPSSRVESIDTQKRIVECEKGEPLPYSNLILATGARPRLLNCPGSKLDNIFVLRNLAEADRLKQAMQPDRHLVIIGGGYVGLECAATAIKAGMNVTLLEAEERLLARVAGKELANFFSQEHQSAGVDIRLDEKATSFVGSKTVSGVVLSSGEELSADLVLVGIGVVPNQELAEAAGIQCGNGIQVNALCETSEAGVYAIGDVSQHPSALYGKELRLESVHNAIEQGKTAAFSIAGKSKAYDQVPWFWSDQYDLKLQIAGLSTDHDQTIIRGHPVKRSFAVFYLKNGVLIACDAVNSPAEYMGSRIMIGRKSKPNPDMLQNPEIPMKALMV